MDTSTRIPLVHYGTNENIPNFVHTTLRHKTSLRQSLIQNENGGFEMFVPFGENHSLNLPSGQSVWPLHNWWRRIQLPVTAQIRSGYEQPASPNVKLCIRGLTVVQFNSSLLKKIKQCLSIRFYMHWCNLISIETGQCIHRSKQSWYESQRTSIGTHSAQLVHWNSCGPQWWCFVIFLAGWLIFPFSRSIGAVVVVVVLIHPASSNAL